MKTNKYLTLAFSLMALLAVTSCVEDDDFSVPQSQGTEENNALNTLLASSTEVEMSYAKALYNSDPNNDNDTSDAIPFLVENDIYIKGYISSSDATGNFFKEIYMQDDISDPSGAVKIILEQTDTYNQFNKGREVYINLKGLYIGEERTGSGVITIGGGTEFDQYGGTVTRLNINQIAQKLLRSPMTEDLIPLVTTFSEIDDSKVGVFVEIQDVEFADNLNGARYFDPNEVYDTARTMQVCNGSNYDEFLLETSSFANFKEQLLPTGNGTIQAVVSKTFDASSYVLALNTAEDVNMEGDRCLLASTIFEERFDDAIDATTLDTAGWLNIAQDGSEVWTEQVYNGNGYAEFSAFGTGEISNVGWLITPGIDLDVYSTETLTFQTEHAYPDAGHDALQVYISTDFDGNSANVASATWVPLDANTSYNEDFEAWFTFTNSGPIDLSSYSGTGYIAFVYTGSDTNNLNMTLHIDNVSVSGE